MSLRRFAMVSDEEVDRIREQQLLTREPNARAANRADQAITSLLENKTKSSNQVSSELEALFLQLNTYLGKALAAKNASSGSSSVPVPATAAPAAAAGEPVHDRTIEMALGSVPVKQKEHARQALERLKEEAITFDKDMRLVIDGEPVKGSNVADLMHAMFTPTLKKLPKHSEAFARALHSANFPTSYVQNPALKGYMRSRSPSPSAALGSSSFTTTSSPSASLNIPTSGSKRNRYKAESKQTGFGFAALASLMRHKRKAKRPAKRPNKRSKLSDKRVSHLYP